MLPLPPEFPEIGHAAQLMRKGKLREAGELCRKICADAPDNVEALFMLGLISGQTGQVAEAQSCFQRAIALRPDYVEAYVNLGNVLRLQNKVVEAEHAYCTALKLKPDSQEGGHNLAALYLSQGDHDKAARIYRQLLKHHPDDRAACLRLGDVLEELGQISAAVKIYRSGRRHWPKDAKFYFRFGRLCKNIGLLDKAEKNLRQALAISLRDGKAHALLGLLYISMGRLKEAESHFSEALAIEPDNVDFRAGMAGLYEVCGDYDKGWALAQELLRSKTRNAYLGLAYGALSRHAGQCRAAIEYIEWVLAGNGANVNRALRKALHFQLAKLYDHLREYANAYCHFSTGNKLSVKTAFDAAGHKTEVTKLIRLFDRHYFEKAPRATNTDSRPIFIIGMPRSGTSLTEQIIASHPHVYGAGELPYVSKLLYSIPQRLGIDKPYPDYLRDLAANHWDMLAREYLQELIPLMGNASCFTDKMPHNYLLIGFISLLFPEARFIHCRRDPLDTCLSCYFHDFSGSYTYTYRLEDLGAYYTQYLRLMQHWRSVLGIEMLEIDYEYLVNRQEEATHELLDFCRLPWDDNCLRFFKSKRHVSTASYDQVRRPMYQSSVRRWKNYEQFIGPLVTALQKGASG